MPPPIAERGSAPAGAASFHAPVRTCDNSLAGSFFNRPTAVVNTPTFTQTPTVFVGETTFTQPTDYFQSTSTADIPEEKNPFDLLPEGFGWGEKYGLDRMPLADTVPFIRKVDAATQETSLHEWNHVWVGVATKHVPFAVSSVSQGDVLGWTAFEGRISLEGMAPIAAAGDVPTIMGAASGSGSDRSTVKRIALSKKTNPDKYLDAAKSEAMSILASIPEELKWNTAEISASLGTVVGQGNILQVIARAEFEQAWKDANLDLAGYIQLAGGKVDYDVQPQDLKLEDLIPETGQFTIIEEFGSVMRISYITDGVVEKEEIICHACAKVNGHSPECEVGQTWGLFNDILRRNTLNFSPLKARP